MVHKEVSGNYMPPESPIRIDQIDMAYLGFNYCHSQAVEKLTKVFVPVKLWNFMPK